MTAIFLRPNATDAAGGWTTSAAGTDLHTAIDEATRDDADFIRSGDNPTADVCRVKLGIIGSDAIAPQSGGVWTIYADESDYSISSSSTSDSWLDVRAGTGGSTIEAFSQTAGFAGAYFLRDDGTYTEIEQYLAEFDVSAVSAATYSVEFSFNVDRDEGVSSEVEIREYDWSGYSASNYVPGADLGGLGLLGAGLLSLGRQSIFASVGVAGTRLAIIAHKPQARDPDPQNGDLSWNRWTTANAAGSSNDPFVFIDSIQNPVSIRYTVAKDGSAALNVIARLKQGSTTIATWTHNAVTTTLTLQTQTLTEAQADEIDWAGVNDDTDPLFLEFQAN
jgi:hypothetical protein